MRKLKSAFNRARVFKLLLVVSLLFATLLVYHKVRKDTDIFSKFPVHTWNAEDPFGQYTSHRIPTSSRIQQYGRQEDQGSKGHGQKADNPLFLNFAPTVTSKVTNGSRGMFGNYNSTTLYLEGLKQNVDRFRQEQEALDRRLAELNSEHVRIINSSDQEALAKLTKAKAEELLQLIKNGSNIHGMDIDVDGAATLKNAQSGPIFVVILARMRTGSTVMGEIFNQNPSMLYLYEPLISIDFAMKGGWAQPEDHRNIASYLYGEYSKCRFPELLTRQYLAWKGSVVKSAKISGKCPQGLLNATKNSWYQCSKNLTLYDLEDICKTARGGIAIKTIRSDLDYLKPLVDAGVNVKIIHLVRDPRGTTNSRKMYYMLSRPKLPPRKGMFRGKLDALGLLGDYPDNVVHTIPRLCQWTLDSVLEVRRKPAWLRGRYKLVRYEDFAADPLRMAQEIYSFLGLEYPVGVQRWLVENTQVDVDDGTAMKTFGTRKNSALTASRWRLQMQMRQVRQVEKLCGQAMVLLGYRLVPGPEQLLNENISLTEPLLMDDIV